MLEEMPVARDREVLVRFYLNDEDREQICRELRLSEEHFNRVIFRARNRFRELIEHRGFWKADLLAIAAIGFCSRVADRAVFRALSNRDTRIHRRLPPPLSFRRA